MELEKNDIQGIVLSGYRRRASAAYVFLEVVDRRRAGRWLSAFADTITTGDRRTPHGGAQEVARNFALTWRGLTKLGLSRDSANFAQEFVEGMSGADYRSRILGDKEESAPSTWQWGPGHRPVDAMLMLYATSDDALAAALADAKRDLAGGFSVLFVRDTVSLPERREHFGFVDGIARPTIAGASRGDGAQTVIAAGEFLFGYPNEYAKQPVSPSVPAALDTADHLVPHDTAGRRDVGRNGSYLVVRQLEQRVEEFWNAMQMYSRGADGAPDREEAVRLAAKCVGRWPSGAPLVKRPDRDDGQLSEDDDFMYAKDDPRGMACPIGAHIRRTNPRDSLEPNPEESLRVVNRHRILRRGRSYGPPLPPFARDTAKVERGLFFMCLNGNIQRQFEFIQQTWANNPKFDGLADDKDPLIGDQPDGGGTFTIPEMPVRRRLVGVARFVRVRGGEYFFLPGVRAVRFLGALAEAGPPLDVGRSAAAEVSA